MWHVVDKTHNIVVASGSTREEARRARKSYEFLTGRKYRVEQF